MNDSLSNKRRLIVVVVVSAAILVALVIAMGQTALPNPGASAPITPVLPASTAAPAPVKPSGTVQGSVRVSIQHLNSHTLRFRYTVKATGKTPVAGFELNGKPAGLSNVVNPGWSYYGDAICHESHPGLLIYWSTNTGAIKPGHSLTFGFDATTSGTSKAPYSVSSGTASPQFGSTTGPAPSSARTTARCG